MPKLRLTLVLAAATAGCTCESPIIGVDAAPPLWVWDGGLPSWLRDGGADGGFLGCGLQTCQSLGAACGKQGDGCGGVIDCGTCTAPETCGGGGVPNQCGGHAGCVPRTCGSAGASCGPISDGCGHLLDCGSCTGTDVCGGGGTPSTCGPPGTLKADAGCTPLRCESVDAGCGPLFDGCGHTLDCGACTGNTVCGALAPNQCAPLSACRARTCQSTGATCGALGDGCGGIIPSCGTCPSGQLCGSGGVPNQCGSDLPDAGVCAGLCKHQVSCDGSSTTLTGVVYAPTDPDAGYGSPDPIPNALVYVPNAPVQPLGPRTSCTQCAGEASGNPLVKATSATDGTFTLTNVPCGVDVPLVIQMGRWRRQVTVPAVACCTTSTIPAALTHLPRSPAQGDVPKIAIVTGSADPIECVLPKMGLDLSTFTTPDAGGRVNFYVDNGVGFDGGAAGIAPRMTALWDVDGQLDQYDLVIADCVGSQVNQSTARQGRLKKYVDSGGRLYASHFSYVWLYQNGDYANAVAWKINGAYPPNQRAIIDTSFGKGMTFSEWMSLVGGSPDGGAGTVDVQNVRYDNLGVNPPTQAWIWGYPHNPPQKTDMAFPMQLTFNTPVSAAQNAQCGRVLFSDFHVATGGAGTGVFPKSCGAPKPMSPQEKVLEYMIFDLTSCIQPDVPTCTLRNCTALGFNCGVQTDGCTGTQDCGSCATNTFCGAGGKPGVCGVATCVPHSCADQGVDCGSVSDGCGNMLDCGSCQSGQVCGGAGYGKCAAACTPLTCAAQGLSCGPAGDGCGGSIECGDCTGVDTCGGGGTAGACGHPTCTPRSCAAAGAACGQVSDGCGGLLDCGSCTLPATCGGGGVPNQCGSVG